MHVRIRFSIDETLPLEDAVSQLLLYDYADTGIKLPVTEQAEKAAQAVARLLAVLCEKNVLSLDEVSEVATGCVAQIWAADE